MKPLEWEPDGNLRSAPALAADYEPSPVPTDVPPVSDTEWAALATAPKLARYFSALQAGRPLAKEGSRDTTLITVLAALANWLSTTDPLELYKYVHSSVLSDHSDGAPTIEKCWGRCQYFAARNASKAEARATTQANPPIVYFGDSYYVRSGDSYRPPVRSVALCQMLEQHSPGIETRTDGDRPWGTAEYLAAYGKAATQVIVEIGRAISTYDHSSATLYEGCCVRREVPAEFDEQVAQWLRLLGGEHADALLDWLATVHLTDYPTCAIYLQGPGGLGKNMLANGVAAIWGCGATAYEEATGAFNQGLTQNPIVFADESLSADGRTFSSVAFRKLIGSVERALSRKFLPPATLRGAVRLIIAANNEKALAIRESLTRDDIEAIAGRILHIHCDPKAGDYLRSLGGWERGTADWVRDGDNPGKIAKHIAWLAANRGVKHGSRFLVEGKRTEFHTDLAIRTGVHRNVLALIATLAGRKTPTRAILRPDETGRADYLVNAAELHGLWIGALRSQPPELGTLADALKTLASGQTARPDKGIRYYVIPADYVTRTDETLQIATDAPKAQGGQA